MLQPDAVTVLRRVKVALPHHYLEGECESLLIPQLYTSEIIGDNLMYEG